MRCLILSDTFPASWAPARGPYNRRQVEELGKLCEASVVAPLPWIDLLRAPELLWRAGKPDTLMSHVPLRHPIFWYLPLVGRGGHWRGIRSAAQRGMRVLPQTRWDMLLATFAYPHGFAAMMLARQLGIPYAIKARGSDLHSLPSSGPRRELTAEALRNAAAVIAVSRNLADIAASLGARADRIHVLPNGVDAEQFAMLDRVESRTRIGLDPNMPVILFVGNLLPVKGVDVLMAALRLLPASPRRLCALIGEGPMAFLCRNQESLPVDVRLIGPQSREQVSLWMNACDVLVLPSRNEGCPNVVLEALCCGTPVVATRVGAVPDILRPDCGIIVPPENPTALAAAITDALARNWDRQTLRRRVETMTWQANAARLHDILMAAKGAAA